MLGGLGLADKKQLLKAAKAADAWCVKKGADSVADLAGYEDELVAHLKLPDIRGRKLASALKARTTDSHKVRHGTLDGAAQVSVEGKKYTQLSQIAEGNSQIWAVRDSHGVELVLKQCGDAAAARAEVTHKSTV